MNASLLNRTRRCTGLLASMALGALPAVVTAAELSERERLRDLELRLDQQEAQRQMWDRERRQREALQGQEEAIRRLEQRLDDARMRLEANTREVAELSNQLGRVWVAGRPLAVATPAPRALLGVEVYSSSGREGALVGRVSPGGAAEEAGIRAGDLIVALDGKDVTGNADPAVMVVSLMREVEPERKVRVEVLRDGRRMAFEVTPRRGPPATDISELLRRAPDARPANELFPALAATAGGVRLEGVEFATVSEGLGRYFGVTSGVLVVRAGSDAPFALQDGDVILAIDGRVPTSAQHAGRILRSYQPGEKVRLRVQRDRKAVDLDTAAPGRAGPAGR